MRKAVLAFGIYLLFLLSAPSAIAGDSLFLMLNADKIPSGYQDALVLARLVDRQEAGFTASVIKVLNGKVRPGTITVADDFKYSYSETVPAVNDYCVLSLKRQDGVYKRAWGVFKADSGEYRTLQLEPAGTNGELACIQWYVNTGGKEKDFLFNGGTAYVVRPISNFIQIYPKTQDVERVLSTLNKGKSGELDYMGKYTAISSLFLLICLVIFRVQMLGRRKGIKAFVFGKTDKRDFLLVPFVLVFFYHILSNTFGWPKIFRDAVNLFFFDTDAAAYLGNVFCVLALIIFYASLVSFGNSFRVGVDTEKPDKLVTTGIFARSRNPLYVAFGTELLGLFLIYPDFISLLYLFAGVLLFHRQIMIEEVFLRAHYGVEYEEYCKRVRRYF